MEIKPGSRFQLHERSGNQGRKGFVLFLSNMNTTDLMVRFDGFAYNSVTKRDWIEILPDEAFRTELSIDSKVNFE